MDMMNKKLAVFSNKNIRSAATVLQALSGAGVDVGGSYRALLKELAARYAHIMSKKHTVLQQERETKRRISDILGRCSVCGDHRGIRVIKRAAGPGNVHGYKSHIFCRSCVSESYSVKSVADLLSEMEAACGN